MCNEICAQISEAAAGAAVVFHLSDFIISAADTFEAAFWNVFII